jgi:biofilm PGA synthesis N-glycosyltransferase PgaC
MRRRRGTEAILAGCTLLVVYTFAGYPAIMALLARVRPRPVRTDADVTPRVTVIVVAHNEQDLIETKLRDTLALDYPADRLAVVVVCDGSDDATAARAARVEGVTVLHEPERRGKLAAMNRAFDATQGDVVVFSGANNHWSPNTLRALVAPLADPEVGVTTGRKGIDDGSGRPLDKAEGLYWRYESKLKSWESAVGSVCAAVGEMLAFRREAYQRPAGGMLTEDLVQVLLAAAAGWRVVYVPEAVSLELASDTTASEAVRRSRLVAGAWQAMWSVLPQLARRRPGLAWQVASHKATRLMIPWALLAIATSTLSLVRAVRCARWMGAAQACFYAAALAGWSLERSGRRSRLLYVPYYFCRMNLASLTGQRDVLGDDSEGVWERVPRA